MMKRSLSLRVFNSINSLKSSHAVNFNHSCLFRFSSTNSFTRDFPLKDWPILYGDLLSRIKEDGIASLEEKFIPVSSSKEKALEDNINHFVDFKNVTASGGNGGDGLVSFTHLFCNDHAGPGGGDGGNGGHVIIEAAQNTHDLSHVSTILRAKPGDKGRSKDCHGKGAPHLFVKVPLGTLIKQNGELICNLEVEGALFVAARGGAGGKGNIYFKSNEHKAPSVAEYGGKGEMMKYDVELQVMADIGLVGFPNAGKSTLLRAISRARPKVAAYPFTTLNPYVGTIKFEDMHQMAVADIPGLIEGAHKNKGLGFNFLRHITRCSCLLYVIDASYEDPFSQLSILKNELDHYSKGLSERPHAIVANKMDLPQTKRNFIDLQRMTDLPVVPISAKMGLNLIPLLALMRLLTEVKSR